MALSTAHNSTKTQQAHLYAIMYTGHLNTPDFVQDPHIIPWEINKNLVMFLGSIHSQDPSSIEVCSF